MLHKNIISTHSTLHIMCSQKFRQPAWRCFLLKSYIIKSLMSSLFVPRSVINSYVLSTGDVTALPASNQSRWITVAQGDWQMLDILRWAKLSPAARTGLDSCPHLWLARWTWVIHYHNYVCTCSLHGHVKLLWWGPRRANGHTSVIGLVCFGWDFWKYLMRYSSTTQKPTQV